MTYHDKIKVHADPVFAKADAERAAKRMRNVWRLAKERA